MVPPSDKRKPPDDWTDTDRAALEAFLKEREHEKWLSERRATFIASAKGVFQWVTAAALAWAVFRDIGSAALKWLKHWLTGAP